MVKNAEYFGKNYESNSVKIIRIITILISVWAYNPYIKSHIGQMFVCGLALLALLLMFYSYRMRLNTVSGLIVLFLAILFFYKLARISDNSWANHSNMFLFFFIMFTSVFLFQNSTRRSMIKLGYILYIVLFANIIYNFILYFIHGDSLYSTKTLESSEGIYASGTNFTAAVMLFAILSLILFLNVKKKIRWFYLLSVILSYYYIININPRATALIILIIFTVGIILFKGGERINSTTIFAFIFIAIAVLFLFQPVLEILVKAEIPYFSSKFANILYSTSGTIVEGASVERSESFSARLFAAGVSLNTWASNPIYFLFGKGFDAGFWEESGIGKHSGVIDILPEFGILGMTVLVFLFRAYFKFIYPYVKHYGYILIFILLFVYGMFNGILFADHSFILTLIAPCLLMTLQDEKKDRVVARYSKV